MAQVNMLDAKTHLSRLVDAIERGEETEVIIARNGKPAARLVPIETKPDVSKRLGLLAGKYPDMSLEEFNEHDAEIEALFKGKDDEGW
ncbi:prevent-host-death protein [Kaistia algarum]|uniref:type II toxin-antitoxin system Phd/YefM family antitoxin n=1 Tax=Kaistia algarum TaxID=2083279 RepID=UPI000CE7FFE7|nr:type II toxin-antitoxin system prevent-host-death family antitoxin [Kaistia algarum]MCX5514591.1 type II toxin-antitoxin system prevent-host-death family antitoxin [Kaistia algarum]PPE78964.1 prevent-host-death protein [Kaistia algarum]